jgi:DNA-binding transcriptional LysR family regulator
MGCGFLPECLVRPYIAAGRLVVKTVDRPRSPVSMSYAWRGATTAPIKKTSKAATAPAAPGAPGRALSWWLTQLSSPLTQLALLERHHSV